MSGKNCRYILVYKISGYADDGGGTFYEEFGMRYQDMDKRVNELADSYEERFSIVCAGFLQTPIEYKPVVYVREYRRD